MQLPRTAVSPRMNLRQGYAHKVRDEIHSSRGAESKFRKRLGNEERFFVGHGK